MEYQKIEETARIQAYERVKQLAEAIKKIRKKYYLCFNRISDIDKQRYDKLVLEMHTVASENGLEKSYAQLMSDIKTQYDEGFPNGNGEDELPEGYPIDKVYQMYLKAIELLAEFIIAFKNATDPKLEVACMKRAQKIQRHIKKLSVCLENKYSKSKLRIERLNLLIGKLEKDTEKSICGFLKSCYDNTRGNSNEFCGIIEIIKNCGKTSERSKSEVTRA